VAAWRHIPDIFTAVAPTNVKWVWLPNIDIYGIYTPVSPLYPGDAYVDWDGTQRLQLGRHRLDELRERVRKQLQGTVAARAQQADHDRRDRTVRGRSPEVGVDHRCAHDAASAELPAEQGAAVVQLAGLREEHLVAVGDRVVVDFSTGVSKAIGSSYYASGGGFAPGR
jgi:hypothetical protein